MTHFHTVFGFPTRGLTWTDDRYDTPKEAWGAVLNVLEENWEQDRARILAAGERHGNVKGAYVRGIMVCAQLHDAGSFKVPSLDAEGEDMSYGVVTCDRAHLVAVK